MSAAKRRLAVMLSGRGSNFEAIADAAARGEIPNAEIVAVVADIPSAPGLERARHRGLPAYAIDRNAFEDRRAHEREVLRVLESARPDIICLAGYMRILSRTFVDAYPGRILNIHPSLLPRHAGLDPQRRALQEGDVESGCTVHVVDAGMDTGRVILQRRVPVLPGDTPESLSARILVEEHALYPAAIAEVLAALPPPRV